MAVLVVALNGPPSCGKDHGAKYLHSILHGDCNVVIDRMSMPLKKGLGGMFSFSVTVTGDSMHEPTKDTDRQTFFGHTYREAQISLSEAMKRWYGTTVFGMLLSRRIKVYKALTEGQQKHLVVLVPDAGFIEEWPAILAEYPVTLIRVKREGYDFSKDSRSYINFTSFASDTKYFREYRSYNYTMHDVVNDGTSAYEHALHDIVCAELAELGEP